MTTPDFRTLCAELLQPLAEYDGANPYHEHRALITRARAALLQELSAPAPVVVPVPVSERLPEPEECTAQGWCWVLYRNFATWTLEPPLGQDGKHTFYTHWLPAHAIPLPQAGEVQP